MISQASPVDFERLHPCLEIVDIYILSRKLTSLTCVEMNRFLRKEAAFKTTNDRFNSHVSSSG